MSMFSCFFFCVFCLCFLALIFVFLLLAPASLENQKEEKNFSCYFFLVVVGLLFLLLLLLLLSPTRLLVLPPNPLLSLPSSSSAPASPSLPRFYYFTSTPSSQFHCVTRPALLGWVRSDHTTPSSVTMHIHCLHHLRCLKLQRRHGSHT